MNIYDFYSYLDSTSPSLRNPSLAENQTIVKEFEKIGRYIIGSDFDDIILVQECYTTNVFPRNICFDRNIIMWDDHFWDIYGRFLFVFFAYLKSGSLIQKQFFSNYYESMILVFLSNRKEGKPALARYIAEAYSKLDLKFPQYNKKEDIEKLLTEIGHFPEFNVAKVFAFSHEIAHIAYRRNNELMKHVKKSVRDFSEVIIGIKELKEDISKHSGDAINTDDDSTFMYNLAEILTSEEGKTLFEEVCCDMAAMIATYTYLSEECKAKPNEIENSLSSIHFFYICLSWLSSTEKFWDALYEEYTRTGNWYAFTDPTNPCYYTGKKLSEEYSLRSNYVFAVCNHVGYKIDDSFARTWVFGTGFNEMLFNEAIGAKYMDHVLSKAISGKKDNYHLRKHIEIKNRLIGWETAPIEKVVHQQFPNNVEAAIKFIIEHIPSIKINNQVRQLIKENDELRRKQREEALYRLELLEQYYGINPNVRKYFEEGRLYYSYITGGCIGSIDTICYDKRYEMITNEFENKESALVYHAIEHNNTIALLFVSAISDNWEKERPQKNGIPAYVWDFDNESSEQGYIKVDIIQGALYLRNSQVFNSLPLKKNELDSTVISEIAERLELLKQAGLYTDLDIVRLFINENEICYSEHMDVFGVDVGVIQRLSDNESYSMIVEQLTNMLKQDEIELVPYFAIVNNTNNENVMAILYASPFPSQWKEEKNDLVNMKPSAIVVDFSSESLGIEMISFSIQEGGPILLGFDS